MAVSGSICDGNAGSDTTSLSSCISDETRVRICSRLVEESRKNGNLPTVVVETDEDDVSLLAVTATDWPGLSTICLSAMQYHGWNLDFAEAFAVQDGDLRRGFVFAGIRDSDPARRRKFGDDSLGIQGLLEKLAEGRSDTLSLMARAFERLETYEKVKTQIGVHYKEMPAPDALWGLPAS